MLENLTQLGLSEKEAVVYLVLLRNGPALASTLALRTQLKRVTIYGVLDSLSLRGLVSFELTEAGRRYLPHDPECLLYNLEQEKAALQVKWNLTKNCIQNLSQSNTQFLDGRQVLFFKGTDEITNSVKDFLDPLKALFGVLPGEISAQEKEFLKVLFNENQKHFKGAKFLLQAHLMSWAKTHAQVKWIEQGTTHKNGILLVQGQKVFFLSQRKELECMLIRNADYASTVFETLIEPYLEIQECSHSTPPTLF